MITLILNADDFGYSKGVNYGIIDAFKSGNLTSTTIMMNMPGATHAIELAKEHPGLGVGIHLVLTCGAPLAGANEVPSLVDEEGVFFRQAEMLLKKGFDEKEVEKEWDTQIQSFYNTGLIPTHLDSHHHVHTHPSLSPIVEKLADRYQLPVRTYPGIQAKPFSDVLRLEFYENGVSFETLEQIVREAREGETVEVMTHPAYLDTELWEGSSYALDRLKELDVIRQWKAPSGVTINQRKW